ncbi:exopolysaccharide biosynthesis protein [Celeribacter sp.]|uniref:exopolysaccharide biosynthesis protein n=1 Tax=Celeribacter sp. TaxID=1890673 RepID=UPI003A9440CF
MREPRSLNDILDALRNACSGSTVSIGDVLDEIGHRSFAPAILVPAVLLVSPVSGIPGLPTFGAILILVFTVQALIGADHIWVPRIIRSRNLPCSRVNKAVDWLERPVEWVDGHTEKRLSFLAQRPWSFVALSLTALLAITMPFLEILPMVTSLACFAISLLILGIMVRDGFLIVAGYLTIGVFAAIVLGVSLSMF